MNRSKILALFLGAILTPVATGLSLQFLPFAAPFLIYGLLGLGFAYKKPDQSWKWGFWLSGGILLALLLVLIFGGSYLLWTEAEFEATDALEAARVTLLFGFIPAAAGSCLGGLTGSYFSGRS